MFVMFFTMFCSHPNDATTTPMEPAVAEPDVSASSTPMGPMTTIATSTTAPAAAATPAEPTTPARPAAPVGPADVSTTTTLSGGVSAETTAARSDTTTQEGAQEPGAEGILCIVADAPPASPGEKVSPEVTLSLDDMPLATRDAARGEGAPSAVQPGMGSAPCRPPTFSFESLGQGTSYAPGFERIRTPLR